jgi:DNA-binding transcriptional MocR family regulator
MPDRVISFARGVPSADCLPVDELADCARAAIARDGATVLNYGPVGGYPPLRAWAAERHGVEPAQVFVGNGSLQSLSLLAGSLIRPDAPRVLVEAPTYDRALHITARSGGVAVPIATDEDGLDPEAVERELDGRVAFLYTIPTFQNPSGRTTSLERRRGLAELARSRRLLIVEDDPYALVRFGGEPLPSIRELAGGENVVYSFSFSKIVAPGLRVAYLVGPRDLVAALEALAVQTYLSPSYVAQATALEFVRRGSLPGSLERVTSLLGERRDAMLDAFDRELPDGATWSRPDGGYFVWLELPGIDTGELLARAEAAGVTFVRGSDFFPAGEGGLASARLAFSFVSPADVCEGVARLAAILPAQVPAA